MVSYKQDETRKKLIIKKINYKEINDVKTSNDFDGYTLIKVIDKCGDIINLFITNKNNKGDFFLEQLLKKKNVKK